MTDRFSKGEAPRDQAAKECDKITGSAYKEWKRLRDRIAERTVKLYKEGCTAQGMGGVFATYCLYLASSILDFSYRNILSNCGQEQADGWLTDVMDATAKTLANPEDAVIKGMDISLLVKGLDHGKPD